MKKIITLFVVFFTGIVAFGQTSQTNGTIYIKHPYIDLVVNANKDYANNDFSTVGNYYADTARWWASGMKDFVPIAEAVKMWKSDFDKFDSIKQTPLGYPDYLQYIKDSSKIVQSWWTWTGKSKKTGEEVKVPMVVFDEFNSDGKISREYIFGDFSKMQ